MVSVITRHRISVRGKGRQPMVFVHGFGCDQAVWDDIAPEFEADHRVVRFDLTGCGRSDPKAWRAERHNTIWGHALDLLDVLDTVGDEPVVLVGHSIGGTIGMLASIMAPERFRNIVAISPSPRYVNAEGYTGGFDAGEIADMFAMMEKEPAAWAGHLAPLVMENSQRPELVERLKRSFLAAEPSLLRKFAEVTFNLDVRQELPRITVPVDILYTNSDVIVPLSVIKYLGRHIPDVHCTSLEARGHYPQLSAPQEVSRTVRMVMGRSPGS